MLEPLPGSAGGGSVAAVLEPPRENHEVSGPGPGLRFEIDDDAANDAALLQALGDRSGSPAVALTTEEIELLSA